jgi:hypothetical protein
MLPVERDVLRRQIPEPLPHLTLQKSDEQSKLSIIGFYCLRAGEGTEVESDEASGLGDEGLGGSIVEWFGEVSLVGHGR